MEIASVTPEDFLQNEEEILRALKSEENLKKLPLLNHANIQNLHDNTLVRFRGMVQDMSNPEYYLEKYAVVSESGFRWQNGRLRDAFVLKSNENIDLENAQNLHGQRRSYFLVTIPGFNDWAINAERKVNEINDVVLKQPSSMPSSLKRPLDQTENMDSVKKNPNQTNGNPSTETTKASPTSSVLSREYLLNSPIFDRPSKACIVKLYSDFDKFPLNTVVDVIGFLSVDVMLDGINHQLNEFDELSEIQATHPPPSLIPRIHAVLIASVPHLNPLLPSTYQIDDIGFDENKCLELFKDIQLVLTQCLFGDVVAAEYLMAHLISAVYVRTEIQSLGQFSLNISRIPALAVPTYSKLLYEVIEMLLPSSHLLPLTLDNLNSINFSPKKDYTTDKLVSGVLQLAPHTHLVLDETQLQVGKLENSGIKAVASTAHLINNQKIKCDFQFYDIEVNVDIPVLILSEGKSMLPSNCHIPLTVEQESISLITEILEAAKFYLQKKLNSIRQYLTILKIVRFNMNQEELTTMIENDIVEMRSKGEIAVDDLHSLIVLSRLICLCRGRTRLTEELWQHTKRLEIERKKRIK